MGRQEVRTLSTAVHFTPLGNFAQRVVMWPGRRNSPPDEEQLSKLARIGLEEV